MDRVKVALTASILTLAIALVYITALPYYRTEETVLSYEVVLDNLNFPVSMAFMPDGRILFNELTSGRIRVVKDWELLEEPFAQIEVISGGERVLLGITLHPSFNENPYVYIYHTYMDEDGKTYNRVARLKEAAEKGVCYEVIMDRIPSASIHNGGIVAFGPDGKLYISTGDATQRELAQDISSLAGKILRINPDGSIPEDNPFPNSPVFSYGHRNVFGLAFHPATKSLYITENGPTRDDEINVIVAGGNYGWPRVLGLANKEAFIDSIYTYTPNIAPTGIAFYAGDKLPSIYRDNLFFGDWNTGSIRRIVLKEPDFNKVLSEEVTVKAGEGILDVENGPDGFLYFTTRDSIMRLVEEKKLQTNIKETIQLVLNYLENKAGVKKPGKKLVEVVV